jgi:hypothetical protein
MFSQNLSLTRFIARVGLVDDIGATFAAHDFAIGVAFFQSLERISDFHNNLPYSVPATGAMLIFFDKTAQNRGYPCDCQENRARTS